MFVLQNAHIFVIKAIMHLSENIDDNTTFLFAKLLNRLTATIFSGS